MKAEVDYGEWKEGVTFDVEGEDLDEIFSEIEKVVAAEGYEGDVVQIWELPDRKLLFDYWNGGYSL